MGETGIATLGNVKRESSSSILRLRARQMHEHAVQFERLADIAERVDSDGEAAMYELVVRLKD